MFLFAGMSLAALPRYGAPDAERTEPPPLPLLGAAAVAGAAGVELAAAPRVRAAIAGASASAWWESKPRPSGQRRVSAAVAGATATSS